MENLLHIFRSIAITYFIVMAISSFFIKDEETNKSFSLPVGMVLIMGPLFLSLGYWLMSGCFEAWKGEGGYENWITSLGPGDFVAKYIFPLGAFISSTCGIFLIFMPFFINGNDSYWPKIIGIIGIIIFLLTLFVFILDIFFISV